MKTHIAACKLAPVDVRELFKEKKQSRQSSMEFDAQPFFEESQSQLKEPSSSSSQPKPNTLYNFVDHLNQKQQITLDKLLARYLYSTCSSFTIVENKHFLKFVKALRPAYDPPSRFRIGGSLLDEEYKMVNEMVKKRLNNTDNITLLSDGWTDCSGTALINIVLTTPTPIFYKAVDPGIESHTGLYISKILNEVISEIGPKKVQAVCTDNAQNMKSAWRIIRETYPHILTYGCAAHSLNLLSKDILKLPQFQEMFKISKKFLKFFKLKGYARQLLKKIQKEESKEMALVFPSETRWGSAVLAFGSLLKNKQFLQIAVLDKKLSKDMDSSLKGHILNDDRFWSILEICHNILKPILILIRKVEGGTNLMEMSLITPGLKELHRCIELNIAPLLPDEKDFIRRKFEDRKCFMHHKVHVAAYLLNPNFCGEELTEDELEEAIKCIEELATQRNLDINVLATEITDYRAKEGQWKRKFLWGSGFLSKPFSWWKAYFQDTVLGQVAIVLLTLSPSASSCERNWKDFSNVKTKKRNRLGVSKTAKLVSVKYNLDLLDEVETNSNDSQSVAESLESVESEHYEIKSVDEVSNTSLEDDFTEDGSSLFENESEENISEKELDFNINREETHFYDSETNIEFPDDPQNEMNEMSPCLNTGPVSWTKDGKVFTIIGNRL